MSLEPNGVPPPNPNNNNAAFVITQPEVEFYVNGEITPLITPSIYQQHALLGNDLSKASPPGAGDFLAKYSFGLNEPIDW